MTTTLMAMLAALVLAPAPRDTVPLYTDLGTLEVPITTSVPLAQRYFDQGMRLTYAFNHPEAIRSFQAALAQDPTCAMCWWGVAFALGPNINAPMDSASGVAAWGAAREAARLAPNATPREQAYIRALQARYSDPPAAPRAAAPARVAAAVQPAVHVEHRPARPPRAPQAQTVAANVVQPTASAVTYRAPSARA